MITKLKAHFEFIRQKKHQQEYGIQRVRAVLIETLDTKWAEELRQASAEVCPVPLFWFTATEIFTADKPIANGNRARTFPLFLLQPEIVLQKVWAVSVEDAIFALTD